MPRVFHGPSRRSPAPVWRAPLWLLLAPALLAPATARAATIPIWTDELVLAPGNLSFGSRSLRVSTLEQPHIACYKDSTGTRTLVYAYRISAGQWRREYVLTAPDLAGPGTPHPGPWLGIDEDTDAPVILYTRQTGAGPWSVWRATKSGATWVHQQLDAMAPPVAFDATVDAALVAHWFSVSRGAALDTLRHSSLGAAPPTHHCSVTIVPASTGADPRWMVAATTETGTPVAFVLNDFDPLFGSGSLYAYAHPDGGGLLLDAAFRNTFSLPGPYLSLPLAASQDPFGTTAISGGPAAMIEGSAGSWSWTADNDHAVYQLGNLGVSQDLSFVDFSPVVYSYFTSGGVGVAGPGGYETVITTPDFFGIWAYKIEGPVSADVGVPSLSSDGRLSTLLTAVEDFTASRRIRFRAYGSEVTGVGEPVKPVAGALRSWPQPARAGGDLWFGGFAEDGSSEVELYDVSGRRVASVHGAVRGGTMRTQVPRLTAGVYFARTARHQGSRLVVAE